MSTKGGFDTSRVVDSIHQEKKGFAPTVSTRCNRRKWLSAPVQSTGMETEERNVLTSTRTTFGLGVSPSSMIQSNLDLFLS